MKFIEKQIKSWGLILLVVTLVMLAWVTVPLAQGATITVTSTADSGPGTLREALTTAVSGDTIVFDPTVFPPGAPATITLTSPLPAVTQGNLTIDGTGAGLIIDGSGTPEDTAGISITSNGNAIKGLHILNFPGAGVAITGGAKDNTIGGDTPEERNVISGNGSGVSIEGSGTDANIVIGNFIGTDASGTAALGNGFGVGIFDSAKNNTIERNVISGNLYHGVAIYGWPNVGTDNNTVIGNYIGTDVNGTAALGNGLNGVRIAYGAKNNMIGGDTPGERNVISGNGGNGVLINSEGTDGNTVIGNYIGTDASGTVAIPNSAAGILIANGARSNAIGGGTPAERNVISGNAFTGLNIWDAGTDNNRVSGNYIGTDASGTVAVPNGEHGVKIENGARFSTIGGDTPGERNVISGNTFHGVVINMAGTDNNTVIGNFIGTDASGTVAVPNGEDGVLIVNGARFNTIGGDTPGERNVISGNAFRGVVIGQAGTDNNTVSGNYIGTDASGAVAMPNGANGITIDFGARFNTIGGDEVGERNVISGNAFDGVVIGQAGTDNNTVIGNFVGTNPSGMVAIPNGANGIMVGFGARFNTIGGSTPGEGNVIAHNGGNGVLVDGSATTGNTISRNSITANGGLGIENQNGGNTELTPPTIASASCSSVSGTAPPNSTVEIFSDPEDEGKRYEGTTTADTTGAFTWAGSITGPNVTATAADGAGNTSEFSLPFLGACYRIYLPILMKNYL